MHEAFASLADQLEHDWASIARPEQLPPDGKWSTWLILAGRGAGKTRTGAEWVRSLAEAASVPRIALVGPTAADVRDTMVEGESGLLAIAPNSNRPTYEPSKRRLTWKNGVQATMFSSEEPERLRGPQFGAAWVDELCAFRNVRDTWSNLQFGLRLGRHPRQVVTTTPKPIPLLRALIANPDTVVSRGTTYDNRDNLAPSFFSQIVRSYEGTRVGRQELNAEILEDVPGALWTRAMIDRAREPMDSRLVRIVVAVDPSGARNAGDEGADWIGIVVAGKGVDGRAYVLADRSCKLSPAGWGARAVQAYKEFSADRIVAERNFGGAMVEHVIRTTESSVAFKEVTASRGKVQRAEPVAALYEQGKVTHLADDLSMLEDQLCQMTGNGFCGDGSPDRADALVWALTELMLGGSEPMNITDEILAMAADPKYRVHTHVSPGEYVQRTGSFYQYPGSVQ
jgi:phage terminase large subunit-like protein